MPAPAAAIYKGDTSAPLLIGRRPRPSSRDLDRCVLVYASLDEHAFSVGQALPGYAGMTIIDIEKEDQGAGSWQLTLNAEGNLSGLGVKVLANMETDPIDGWDTMEQSALTTNPNHFYRGQRQGNFVCIDATRISKRVGAWLEVRGKFAGLRGYRQPIREISCNGHVITADLLAVNLEQGWADSRKGQAQLPRVVVTDRRFTTQAPQTQAVPGMRTPIAAPPVRNITFSGSDVRSMWPHGWSYTCAGNQPFGIDVQLWVVSDIYEWTPRFLPA